MTEPQAPSLPPLTPEQQDMRELVQRLARVQAKIADPVKATAGDSNFDKKLKHGGVKEYKFADLTTVLQTVRPALASEGLAFTQELESNAAELRVCTVLMYGLASRVSVWAQPMPPMPVDRNGQPMAMGQAQKIGACTTYARRKALLAIVGVQDDEQDDHDLEEHEQAKAEKAEKAAERKDEVRAKAQERAAESRASSESAPQPMTNEELKAQAELLQKWARERGVEIPSRGVLSAIFAKKGWDITSRAHFQEWRRSLDDEAKEPGILSFLRTLIPATEPEPPTTESSGAAVMKAISGWAKVQGLANPDDEENARTAISALLGDLGMEHATMTAKKWGVALARLTDPKATAHWLAVLGECYPPF